MTFIFILHSFLRWIVLLVALVAVVKFAVGWARKTNVMKMDRALMSAFSGLLDLQVALGIVLLLMQGDFSMPRIEHAITMIVAAVVAHLPMRWRNRVDTKVLRNNLIVVGIVIVLIVAGIASLPGNRWFVRF